MLATQVISIGRFRYNVKVESCGSAARIGGAREIGRIRHFIEWSGSVSTRSIGAATLRPIRPPPWRDDGFRKGSTHPTR